MNEKPVMYKIFKRRDSNLAPFVAVLRGFTLIELMVALAVLAILLGLVAPSFSNVMLGSKLASHASSLVASAQLARGEAIKRNIQVQLCSSANGTSCASSGGWEQGWIVKVGTEVLLYQQSLPTDLKIIQTEGGLSLNFHPTGVGSDRAKLTICRSNPVGSQERVVSISTTGSATVSKTTTGSCGDS